MWDTTELYGMSTAPTPFHLMSHDVMNLILLCLLLKNWEKAGYKSTYTVQTNEKVNSSCRYSVAATQCAQGRKYKELPEPLQRPAAYGHVKNGCTIMS